MWEAKYEKTFEGLGKEAIWSAWIDVNNWAEWDVELDYAKIQGAFAPGNKFFLKPKGGPRVSVELIAIKPLASFTDVTRFPFAKMFDRHELEETSGGLKIKSRISVEGPLGWLWAKIVARGVAAGVPAQMESLVAYARRKNEA
jgi:hypothetical protein